MRVKIPALATQSVKTPAGLRLIPCTAGGKLVAASCIAFEESRRIRGRLSNIETGIGATGVKEAS
jgi:hypothetical protein